MGWYYPASKKYKIAEQHFLESISHVQPIEKKIPELAANLYYDLGICELNQYAQSVKESQCDKHDYKKGIAHIDYALELRAASVSSGRQQALPVDIKYIPLGGNADYAKLAISDLVEKWKNHENLLSSIWELYRILGELDFQTESYSKANDWFSRAKLYYLKINAPDSSTIKQLESKILESHKLADGEESCL